MEKQPNGEREDAETVKAVSSNERKAKKILKDLVRSRGRGDVYKRQDKKTVEQFPAFPGDNQDMPLDMIKPEHNRKFMGRKLERVKSGAVGQDGNFKIVEGW